jgi:hypothetical protein
VFAEIGEKIIADYGVDSFETFTGGCLFVLGSGGGCDRRERDSDESG